MDSLLVDLDKVLDDFEAEERLAPGSELEPSGFREYLEASNEQTWKVIDNVHTDNGSVDNPGSNIPDKPPGNVLYDFPYEPESFDLSEADFAPSSNLGDSGYNGSLALKLKIPSHDNVSQLNNLQVNGITDGVPDANSGLPRQSDHSASVQSNENFVKNNLGVAVSKYPVQADNSPISDLAQGAFQLNGHLGEDEQLRRDANSSESAASVPSGSVSSASPQPDGDKYPVQCNTPQTPKENPFKNPFEMQMNKQSSGEEKLTNLHVNTTNSLHESSQDHMQDIPKLNNLQKELDLQAHSNPSQPSSKHMGKNYYSLPANFYEKSQNGVNHSGSSLPTELSDQTQNFEGEENHVKDKSNLHAHRRQEIDLNANTNVPNQSPQQPRHEQPAVSKEVVGFDIITDDLPECDHQKFTGSATLVGNPKLMEEKVSVISACQKVEDNVGKLESGVLMGKIQTLDKRTASGDTDAHKQNKVGDEIEVLAKLSEQIDSQICDADLEVLKLLPTGMSDLVAANPKSVIPNSDTALSPGANVSMDSGCASMTDMATELPGTDVGARPKDINQGFAISDSMAQNNVSRADSADQKLQFNNVGYETQEPVSSVLQVEKIEQRPDTHFTHDSRELMEVDKVNPQGHIPEEINADLEQRTAEAGTAHMDMSHSGFTVTPGDVMNNDGVEMRQHPEDIGDQEERPHSWDSQDSGQPQFQKQKRPTSLNLPPPPAYSPSNGVEEEEEGDITLRQDPGASSAGDMEGSLDGLSNEATVSEDMLTDVQSMVPQEPPPPYSTTLGTVAPTWVPDADAPVCMSCDMKFTFRKRRHHCRACGKVFCSNCCSMKNKLEYLKFQEARVCLHCHKELAKVEAVSSMGAPLYAGSREAADGGDGVGQAVAGAAPTVMLPVHGVLKHDGSTVSSVRETGGSRRSEPKQVMFSDGIRPGGDLTELDGRSSITRTPRRSRVQKRVEKTGQGGQQSPRSRRLRTVTDRTCKCLIPDDGLPPLSVPLESGSGHSLESPDPAIFMPKIKDEESPPVIFAVNANLFVSVKIVNLDCCVSRVVWCFTTRGMTTVGQEELTIVLEYLPEEEDVPRDIFVHLNNVFEEASKGAYVTELGHSIFNQSFLGSREHGGFLYIRATFQCTQKLHVPDPPFLFGILLQKWETPWAKVFPIRLLLRLGAEYRYYPCPLIGVRNRKPVFFEIGHTIMNLLADFRNFQYMLPGIRGITIHMEDKVTKINFPRNRYDELMKVVNNSNEHVMAIGANFSSEADSHLVCIQNDEGNYQTQAINIQNKPRKVTGASFVVFNGALKSSSGLSAKSSIVEDGLMVQITPDSMLALKQSMKDMQSYTIICGVSDAPKPDETVIVQWVDDDKNVNIGVKSPVDNMLMDGIESLRVQNTVDYVGENHIIRWTEVFFIQNRDSGSTRWEPVDLSRLGETLATACCVALTPNLDKLKELTLTKIGLRVTLGSDNVGYEAGSQGQRLPDAYMNDLDNELIPVIHRATQHEGSIVLELIFQIMH